MQSIIVNNFTINPLKIDNKQAFSKFYNSLMIKRLWATY